MEETSTAALGYVMATFFCATLTVVQKIYLAINVDQAHTIFSKS
jgi:hypothetical protein